ncbi:hypothetical protein GGF46_001793 [Coemansia sp. RSA 552]|nr:hypothetical protein GGF46_001793 [Coemansia sp. RSA 552]
MHLDGGHSEEQARRGPPGEDLLPSYEETLETAPRKQYTLRRTHTMSRTVQAVERDTERVAYTKKTKMLPSSRLLFFAGDRQSSPLWTCKRERHGLELVFSRRIESPMVPPPPPLPLANALPHDEPSPPPVDEEPGVDYGAAAGSADGIALDSAANMYDNKPAETNREYLHRENDDAPPAYAESDPGTEQQVRLVSTDPFPFAYDFTLPGISGPAGSSAGSVDVPEHSSVESSDGHSRHRWLRNHETKNPGAISADRPWSEFMCVEQGTGRLLAEVVHYTRPSPGLGTLVIHGDLDPDQHEFLVISAIAVVEEYPLRSSAHLALVESQAL